MTVLVDTSALLAYFDAEDPKREAASDWLYGALSSRTSLLIHSYAVGETVALMQKRFGLDAVREYATEIEPALEIVWVDERLHRRALASLLVTGRRGVSLVDHVSFEVMREEGIDTAFAFDADFAAEGFRVVPS